MKLIRTPFSRAFHRAQFFYRDPFGKCHYIFERRIGIGGDNMNTEWIILQLETNKSVFKEIFENKSKKEYLWKPARVKWCMLEMLCHLYDEEREDFRARVLHTLENPDQPLKPINPPGWVIERNYIEQDYDKKLAEFLSERDSSIGWLRSLKNPDWERCITHPNLGEMSANKFLANWLAHDYLHFRQITKLKYDYLKHASGQDLSYAGDW
jgi:hypothetical protein